MANVARVGSTVKITAKLRIFRTLKSFKQNPTFRTKASRRKALAQNVEFCHDSAYTDFQGLKNPIFFCDQRNCWIKFDRSHRTNFHGTNFNS